MKYLQIQIKYDSILFSGWHNYPTRYNIDGATDEQLLALIQRSEQELFPYIEERNEGCKLRYRIVNLKAKKKK